MHVLLYIFNLCIFLGIKATSVIQQMQDMNEVCYEKVIEQVKKGQQVIVEYYKKINLNAYKLLLPSGNPSGKYTKY